MIFYIEFLRPIVHIRHVLASSSTVVQTIRRHPPVPISVRRLVNWSRTEWKRRLPNLFPVKIREIPIIQYDVIAGVKISPISWMLPYRSSKTLISQNASVHVNRENSRSWCVVRWSAKQQMWKGGSIKCTQMRDTVVKGVVVDNYK